MLLTFKTLQQKTFQIEADPSETIANVKEKIEKSQGHVVSQQKLIFSGKILADDKQLSEFNITEKDFLVIMVSKPKASSSAAGSGASTPSRSVPVQEKKIESSKTQEKESKAEERKPLTRTESTASTLCPPASNTESTSAGWDDSTSFLTGSNLEAAISNLMEMGFERDQVVKAMRASFNNPNRAAEYLMNGIPEHLQQASAPLPSNTPSTPVSANPGAETTTSPTSTAGAQTSVPGNLFEAAAQAERQRQLQQSEQGQGGLGDDLSFLRRDPQFQQLRQLVQQNPALLQPVLQQLGQTNPQLLQVINQNQEAFLQLLMGEGGGGGEGESGSLGGAQYVSVTPEEKEAIDRLEALGFERALAIEAFLACDRNEELAANYLFDNGNEADEE